MPFDPDAYLARPSSVVTNGFDPDAYLARPDNQTPSIESIPGMDDMANLPSKTEQDRSMYRELPESTLAALGGATDTLTLGTGDYTTAGMMASYDKFADVTGVKDSEKSFVEMYQDRLAGLEALDAEQEEQYPTARQGGEYAGIAGQMVMSPGTATKTVAKPVGAGLSKLKGMADEGVSNVSKGIRENVEDLIPASFKKGTGNLADKVLPETTGDAAAMYAGSLLDPLTGVIGAAGGVVAKRKLQQTALPGMVQQTGRKVGEVGARVADVAGMQIGADAALNEVGYGKNKSNEKLSFKDKELTAIQEQVANRTPAEHKLDKLDQVLRGDLTQPEPLYTEQPVDHQALQAAQELIVPEEVSQIDSMEGQSEPEMPEEIRRKDPSSGRVAVFNAASKEFIRWDE